MCLLVWTVSRDDQADISAFHYSQKEEAGIPRAAKNCRWAKSLETAEAKGTSKARRLLKMAKEFRA